MAAAVASTAFPLELLVTAPAAVATAHRLMAAVGTDLRRLTAINVSQSRRLLRATVDPRGRLGLADASIYIAGPLDVRL